MCRLSQYSQRLGGEVCEGVEEVGRGGGKGSLEMSFLLEKVQNFRILSQTSDHSS